MIMPAVKSMAVNYRYTDFTDIKFGLNQDTI